MKSLRGRTVLLTGASTGIGPHIAARLHDAGASLVLSSRHADALERLGRELEPARVVVADLSLHDEVQRLADEAGDIDVLVANAGIPASGELVSFSVDQIDRAVDVNLRSAMILANRLLPGMLARKSGHLVLIASMHSKLPTALVSVYNATKFGLRGFGLALRQELRGTGVGVSVINPTFVAEQGMWAETGTVTPPLAGLVRPTQVADAVLSAITADRAEVDVAPLAARMAAAMPYLVGRLARRLGAADIPPAAVERQFAKR
jgi:short-subunit dehydrogenase